MIFELALFTGGVAIGLLLNGAIHALWDSQLGLGIALLGMTIVVLIGLCRLIRRHEAGSRGN
jgi:hypothetical protein